MDKFTKRSKKILSVFAQAEGRRLNSDSIGPEHILLAILKDEDSVAARILRNLGLKFPQLKKEVEQTIKKTGTTIILGNIPFNIRYNRILEIAIDEARKLNNSYIGTEHLLLSLFRDGTCSGVESLKKLGIDYNLIRGEILKIIDQQKETAKTETEEKSPTPTLDAFARNLTHLAAAGELDPVIGRDSEIERVIRILSRKRKNNPVLIGEAGVGKTAIVEGLAQRIVNKKIPDLLHGKEILALDIAAVVAGTKFRGEFEERIKKIMKEIKDTGNIIIFIDELHTIIGAGAAEGAIDAANILKPALSRGDIQCIGATTLGEYKKYIEKDPALERRFQTVLVDEPSIDETIDILRGLKERYETHHKVRYTDESLVKAAMCAQRYIHERYLPDKAIDIIDEAGSKARLENCEKPLDIIHLENEIEELNNRKNELVRTQE
ncbi:MAG: ATP-dependent Clp protease ATP-binding subunit, partial [Spirochaetes bacterium]|nr:ATP-dependent Clp protease ATP-binding subunit [Spirochaetota bacterium]